MQAFFIELIQNKFVRWMIAILVSFVIGAGFAAWEVSSHYQKENAAKEAQYKADLKIASNKAATVNTVVVTKYKTKIQKVIEHEKAIDQKIDSEMKNEDKTCTLGPDFVRLYNDSASGPLPDTGSAADVTSTENASKTGSGSTGERETIRNSEGK